MYARWSFSSDLADPIRVTPIVRGTEVRHRGYMAMSCRRVRRIRRRQHGTNENETGGEIRGAR